MYSKAPNLKSMFAELFEACISDRIYSALWQKLVLVLKIGKFLDESFSIDAYFPEILWRKY